MVTTLMVAKLVENLPENLDNGVLYVSTEHAVASHKCACGCGRETVTPLSPTDWQFDSRTISLKPSVGNWNFPCRSHYWINNGTVRWAASMSSEAIERGRARSRATKKKYYEHTSASMNSDQKFPSPVTNSAPSSQKFKVFK